MIPVQLSDISGLDLVAANVLCAMGEDPQAIDFDRTDAAYATHVLHTLQHGIYDSIEIDDTLAQNVYRMVFYVQKGDEVEPFIGAGEALGIVFMKFDSQQQMRDRISKISDHIHISLT